MRGLLIVRKAVKHLGLEIGDVLSLEPGAAEAIVLYRAVDIGVFELLAEIYESRAIALIDASDPAVAGRSQLVIMPKTRPVFSSSPSLSPSPPSSDRPVPTFVAGRGIRRRAGFRLR